MYREKYIKYKIKYDNLKNNFNIDQKGGNNDIKEIYFIRHGQTDWNLQKKTQGQEADIELNNTGKQESKKTGAYLKKYRMDKEFDCIISSPMIRCRETSEEIAKQIGFDLNKIQYDDDLKELKKGNMSGLTNKDDLITKFKTKVDLEINKIKDPIEKYEISNPYKAEDFYQNIIEKYNIDINNLETKEEILDRANNFINVLKERNCKKIIVVSHSGTLEVLLKLMLKLNVLPKGDTSNGSNCSIALLTLDNDNSFSMISPQNTEHLSI